MWGYSGAAGVYFLTSATTAVVPHPHARASVAKSASIPNSTRQSNPIWDSEEPTLSKPLQPPPQTPPPSSAPFPPLQSPLPSPPQLPPPPGVPPGEAFRPLPPPLLCCPAPSDRHNHCACADWCRR
eukprot:scaffold1330_cov73-Isochrysis_galbana.AAC.1